MSAKRKYVVRDWQITVRLANGSKRSFTIKAVQSRAWALMFAGSTMASQNWRGRRDVVDVHLEPASRPRRIPLAKMGKQS